MKDRILSRFLGRSKKRSARYGILLANMAMVVVAGLLIVAGTDPKSSNISASASVLSVGQEDQINPLDELSSADIAVNVARVAQLDEATSVTNKADTVNAGLAIASAEDSVVAKPQIISSGLKSKKDIIFYTSEKGDTIQSVAKKFGVTSDTIRLSNSLNGDVIAEGTDLVISPINGIVYVVKPGDTLDSISAKFRADPQQLVVFNDAELTRKFKPRERIVIPDGLQPVTNAISYNYSSPGGFAFGSKPVYGNANGYDYGWCTWHAANRRAQAGHPIPSNLGNAVSWLGLARSAGLPTGSEPRAGAVLYHLNMGGMGHVAYVERVNKDGSFEVSDMNYPLWGSVTYRKVKASETSNYRFIY